MPGEIPAVSQPITRGKWGPRKNCIRWTSRLSHPSLCPGFIHLPTSLFFFPVVLTNIVLEKAALFWSLLQKTSRIKMAIVDWPFLWVKSGNHSKKQPEKPKKRAICLLGYLLKKKRKKKARFLAPTDTNKVLGTNIPQKDSRGKRSWPGQWW